jgi:HEPN domain-containing protein
LKRNINTRVKRQKRRFKHRQFVTGKDEHEIYRQAGITASRYFFIFVGMGKRSIFAALFFVKIKNYMTSAEKVKYWIEISDDDLKASATMLAGGHYLYVGFMCHQCIEKIFKAAYEYRINDTPPFIHDLVQIADKAGISEILTKEQTDLLEQLNPLNIRARYPDYKKKLASELTKSICENLIVNTQKLQQWTKETILLTK